MSMSASLNLTTRNDQPRPNQPYTFMMAVSNSGASTVNVTSIIPQVTPLQASCSVPAVQLATNGATSWQVAVPAASTVFIPFRVVFFAPTKGGPSTIAYTVTAQVQSDDNSVFQPPPVSVTVGAVEAATPTAGGNLDFSSPLDSGELLFFW